MKYLSTVAARLREPSTAAGLAVLAALFGVPAGVAQDVVQVVAGLAAVAAVVIPESKP